MVGRDEGTEFLGTDPDGLVCKCRFAKLLTIYS